ncbi:g9580 [Coccomyxa elongata]
MLSGTKVQDSASLETLPEDILHLIFRSAELHTAAGTKERCRLAAVCRRWKAALYRPEYWREIELNTGDFKASSAFAEGLLSCAARAGQWLQRVRVVQALPGRGCTPKVVYGDSGTRLEMYRGAQSGFSAEGKELEAWLKLCHERVMCGNTPPSRKDAAWQSEFDRIEEVMCGKRFRIQKPRLQPEIMNFVLAFGQWVAATGSAIVFIAGCTIWARLIIGWVIWPSLLAAAFIVSNI